MRRWAVLGLCVGAWVAPPRAARACATAPPLGGVVEIVGEQAVIVWDAARGVEHFIRRADFQTDAESFGFIVPTPTVPQLAEASERLFERLAEVSRPQVRVRSVHAGVTLSCLPASLLMRAGDAAPGDKSVRVLRHQTVAGYDAVVLEASDPQALSTWLAANGYAASDNLSAWAKAYVDQGWKFTAFKVAKHGGDTGVVTAPVRMSFASERPFYPYREPAHAGAGADGGERTLQVYFVADQRYDGALQGGAVWPGEVQYARSVSPRVLQDELAGIVLPDQPYLTAVVDHSSPRPGDADVFFAPSHDGDVTPEPIETIQRVPFPVPVELLVVVGGIGLFIWRRKRRRAERR